jgi:hypothetical protein
MVVLQEWQEQILPQTRHVHNRPKGLKMLLPDIISLF